MTRFPRQSVLSRSLLVLGLLLSLLAIGKISNANAAAQFTTTRVYYQPYASTSWSTWSGNTCPVGARYSTNYGCVYANSVSSHSTLRYTNLDGSGTTDININCTSGVNPHWQAPWNGVNKILVDEINGKLYIMDASNKQSLINVLPPKIYNYRGFIMKDKEVKEVNLEQEHYHSPTPMPSSTGM